MTVEAFTDLPQGSDAWLQARAGIPTASVMGQLITSSTLKPAKNDTARSLTAHLVAEKLTGYVEDSYTSADMERGQMSEPYARQLYAEHTGQEVDECGFVLRTEYDFKVGWSPDGLCGYFGGIEIKAPRAKKHIKTMLEDQVPPEHMPQVQTGLFVSGREWLDFVSYCGGHPLFIKRVYPEPAWHEGIAATVRHFEQEATRMIKAYKAAGKGMPVAERINFYEEIVIK